MPAVTNFEPAGGPYDEHDIDPAGLSDVEYCRAHLKRYMDRKEIADSRGDHNIARYAQDGINFWTKLLNGLEPTA